MTDDLRALLERARGGDPAAVEALMQSNLPGLRAFIRLRSGQLLRAKESVSDLVQSVCREVLQDLPGAQVENEAAFRGWLYTAAHRKILDRRKYWEREMRDAAREQPLEGAPGERERGLLASYGALATPSRHAEVKEEVARIERAFEQLSEEHREVITLARIAGLTHGEIAERMGKSEEAVRQLLARARARLARLLSA
jgi:RNA polymerase sigma-70 factor (ECF subfamily)